MKNYDKAFLYDNAILFCFLLMIIFIIQKY
jgi:hypothetical protein